MSAAPSAPAAASSQPARWAWALLWVVPGLWSSNYIIARQANGVISPHLLASARWLLAAALLLLFLGHRHWPVIARAGRQEWRHWLVLGTLGMTICGAWLYEGARSTTAANMALIYAATPVAIAALSARLLHEKLRGRQKAGAVLALLGVLFVIVKGDFARLLAVRFVVGDLWVLACAFAWMGYSVLLKYWPSSLDPVPRLVGIIAGGLVVLLPFTLLEAVLAPSPPLGAQAAWLVLAAAVLPGVLSYGAYSVLQRELGASRTALMIYLAPVYGALLGWLMLGEVPRWYHAVGAALILPSIWLATRE